MASKKKIILFVSIGIVALAGSIGGAIFFVDSRKSTENTASKLENNNLYLPQTNEPNLTELNKKFDELEKKGHELLEKEEVKQDDKHAIENLIVSLYPTIQSQDAVAIEAQMKALQSAISSGEASVKQKTEEKKKAAEAAKKKKEQEAKKAAEEKKKEEARLAAEKERNRPVLACNFGDMPGRSGALIMQTYSGPAREAGLSVGDVITHIEGHRIYQKTDIGSLCLNNYSVGDEIEVRTSSGSSYLLNLNMSYEEFIEMSPADLPPLPKNTGKSRMIGLKNGESQATRTSSNQIGVYVISCVKDSPLDESSIRPGDVIIKVDDWYVSETTDIAKIVTNCDVGDSVYIQYVRDGEIHSEYVDVVKRG